MPTRALGELEKRDSGRKPQQGAGGTGNQIKPHVVDGREEAFYIR